MIIQKNISDLVFNWSKPLLISISKRTLVNKADIKPNFENEINTKPIDKEWNKAYPFEKIPGPSKFGLIRGFLPGGKYYKIKRADFMKLLFNEYGDIFRITGVLGKRDMIIIRDPNNFEKVHRTEGIWPYRLSLETMVHYRTIRNPKAFMNVGGLLSEQNESWGKFRSIVNPILMQPRTVKMYIPKMDKVADEFLNKIIAIRDPESKEVPSTFENTINIWALEAVSVVALDTHLGLLKENSDNSEAKKIIDSLSTIFALTVDLELNPSIWRLIRTPKFYQLMKAYDEVTQISGKYVNEALKRYENDNSIEKNENEKSVLERLLKHDKKVAVVMAMDMLMAGVDTTTTAFTGCLLSLAKNPEKQVKLRKEIMKIMPSKNTPLTIENMKNLPYLRACIKESLRIYPVIPGNMRAAGQDITLCGYQIPKDTHIAMVSQFENTEFDFNKANEYIPERWLRIQEDPQQQNGCPSVAKSENPFAFLPFGFGPRSCIGKRIVEMELETALAKIIRNFYIEFNYPTDDIFALKLISVPNKPLKFKFIDIVD